MTSIKILGIDLGKSNFHALGHDASGNEVFRKKFNRKSLIEYLHLLPPTTIAFEACGGAHWLARRCESFGHQVKLLPPQYVRPYVKGNKNDFIDADAIAEAASRPSMRFVTIKSESAQLIAVMHRARSAFVKERTATMSRIGSILLEFGISLPQGHKTMKSLFAWLAKQSECVPPLLIQELQILHEHYIELNDRIKSYDQKLSRLANESEDGKLLQSIPGVGPLIASQCLADLGSVGQFKNGRNMAAWMGLVPRQYSTGGKPTLLGISKRGNVHLRTLFIHGARAILSKPDGVAKQFGPWLERLRATKPYNVVTVALANKLARIAWSVLNHQQPFNAKLLHA